MIYQTTVLTSLYTLYQQATWQQMNSQESAPQMSTSRLFSAAIVMLDSLVVGRWVAADSLPAFLR